jgi:hypothetical protein
MSEELRRDNSMSPLPRVQGTLIYWIGGLLACSSCQAASRIVSASRLSTALGIIGLFGRANTLLRVEVIQLR